MGLRRSRCVFGRLALFAERRLAAFVGFALGNVGDLGTHFEYDPFDAASGCQIATGAHRASIEDMAVKVTPTKSSISASTSDCRTSLPRFSASLSCNISVLALTWAASR